MKPDDLRAMTIDQLDDEVLKLKKEQFNLRFQRATGSWRIRRGCARCAATSRASRRSRHRSVRDSRVVPGTASIKPKRIARSKAK